MKRTPFLARPAHRLLTIAAASLIAVTSFAASQPRAGNGLKVYISVDMEGVAGVVTADQLGPEGFEYERFRNFMTEEALAAVRAAKAAGAGEILVSDSHGNGESLLIEKFPRDVHIIRSWPRKGGMMGGLDSSFDAAIMIGYHASASSHTGVRAHTYSSATFTRVTLNGQDVSEGAIGAAQAGELGVPVVLLSGDDAATAEMRKFVPNLVTVETKKALSFHSAMTITPAESVARIEAGVRDALARVKDIKPYVISKPVTVELSYKNYAAAESMSLLRSVQRIGSRTIRFVAQDAAEASDFISFADGYQPDLKP